MTASGTVGSRPERPLVTSARSLEDESVGSEHEPTPSESTRSLVERIFTILSAFDGERREHGISDLAVATGLPKSTIHRIAADLVESGVLVAIGSRYRIGIRLFELGTRWIPSNLKEIYDPYLNDLSNLTKGTVQGALLEGVDVVYLERLASHGWHGPPTRIGSRRPAYCTGLGKAILGFSPDAVVERVITAGLAPRTSHTIVDPSTFRAELGAIRAAGVAFDRQEFQLGIECVAAPVLAESRVPISAISISVPVGTEDLERLAQSVRRTADVIARIIRASPSNHAVASTLGRAGTWQGRFK